MVVSRASHELKKVAVFTARILILTEELYVYIFEIIEELVPRNRLQRLESLGFEEIDMKHPRLIRAPTLYSRSTSLRSSIQRLLNYFDLLATHSSKSDVDPDNKKKIEPPRIPATFGSQPFPFKRRAL